MSSLSELQADEKQCPLCQEWVEPEVDGDHRYYECQECLYAWGYERVSEGTRVEGSCAIGVPEAVRKAASLPAEKAAAILDREERQNRPASPISLGMPTIGRRPPTMPPP